VNCPIEIVNGVGKFCSLCNANLSDEVSLIVNDFEININDSDWVFKSETIPIAVKYKWGSDNSTIEFQFKENSYKFKLSPIKETGKLILEDTKGLKLNLEKM
jgi:hypothetical protein